jgi:hypothetical protein
VVITTLEEPVAWLMAQHREDVGQEMPPMF